MKMFIIAVNLITLYNSTLFSQWQSDVRLTNFANASYTSYNNAWNVASSGNVVHAVWYDSRVSSINYEIYYKRSTDAGLSWGEDIRLTSNAGDSHLPSVAVSGSVVHVAWQDKRDGNFEIYYKRSTDGGISWGADTRLTNAIYDSWHPSVSVSGSNVHIVWQDRRDVDDEIYYKRSTNGGASWDADTRLTNNYAISAIPSVAVSGQNVHVVWSDFRNGNYEIYYKRSADGGISWGIDTRHTNNFSVSNSACVTVSDSIVHTTWSDTRDGNEEIYYKRSSDGGVNWGIDTRLTFNSSGSYYPSATVSGSAVHIVWQDSRNTYDDIYYKRSTDGGISWESDTRLTVNVSGAGAWNPSVSVSDPVVHAVWNDYRIGSEIWYKRDPTGNSSGNVLTLNFSAFIEGFYNSVTNSMISDTVKVYLKNASFPFNIIDSSNGLLSSSGTGNFLFSNALNGVNYYLAIKHRNSIETWSSDPIIFVSGNSSYSFIALQSMVYGNNQIQIDSSPLRFGVYSGDVNQDGAIDLTDAGMINNDVFLFASGYLNTDLNSDGVVDLADGVFTDNNSYNFVTRITP